MKLIHALIDPGSQIHLFTEETSQLLGLHLENTRIYKFKLIGLTRRNTNRHKLQVSLQFTSEHSPHASYAITQASNYNDYHRNLVDFGRPKPNEDFIPVALKSRYVLNGCYQL